MKAISSAIVALAGAVIMLSAPSVSPEYRSAGIAGVGFAIVLTGLVAWAVSMRREN